jgi:hypothetical protein
MEALIFLLVIGASMWVAADASALAGRGTGKGGGTSTAGWVIGCLLLWIIAFPLARADLRSLGGYAARVLPLGPYSLPAEVTT